MTDLDRAELRRLAEYALQNRDEADVYDKMMYQDVGLLVGALRVTLDALDKAEAEVTRLSRIHRGTGKLALSALFLADLDEDTQAVESEVVRAATARAAAAEATLERVREMAKPVDESFLSSPDAASFAGDILAALAPVTEEGDGE